MICIIDYEAGNLRSVQKALEKCGADARITSDPRDLLNADKVVFPGVGAFGQAMKAVERFGFVEPIRQFVDSGKPFLGICLGLQLMFESSEESPGVPGLSLFRGHVKRLAPDLKAPHLGWNEVRQVASSPLWHGVADGGYFYFAHTFYIQPTENKIIVGETDYGGRVPVAVQNGNVFGLQFHPEKSQALGLKIVENFVNLEDRNAYTTGN